MNNSDERYPDEKLELIRGAVAGASMASWMSRGWSEDSSTDTVDTAMSLIERDVRNIYRHAKRRGKAEN